MVAGDAETIEMTARCDAIAPQQDDGERWLSGCSSSPVALPRVADEHVLGTFYVMQRARLSRQ